MTFLPIAGGARGLHEGELSLQGAWPSPGRGFAAGFVGMRAAPRGGFSAFRVFRFFGWDAVNIGVPILVGWFRWGLSPIYQGHRFCHFCMREAMIARGHAKKGDALLGSMSI